MKKLTAIILVLVSLVVLSACKTDADTEREAVSEFAVATFEYKNDDGYKLITGEINSLDTFDSLRLKPSETEFQGDWIYRIIFNPSEYSKNTEEFIILFGEQNISINGKAYTGDNVPYSKILNWAEEKYKYFDYELIGY